MYCDYWKLNERPFQNVADPRFFFESEQHEEALLRVIMTLKEQQGALVMTGEYGCGKTLVSRMAIKEMAGDSSSKLVTIVNPRLGAIEFLIAIVRELGGYADSKLKVDVLGELRQLLENNFKANRETALIVDDAQAIEDDDVLEEIRLLLNFQMDDLPLLHIIMLGQPELRQRISRMQQLEQRVGLWFHLAPFSEAETGKYIRHRLKVAGRTDEIFPPKAVREVHGISGGIPRRVNNICNMSLMAGWLAKVDRADKVLVQDAARSIQGVRS